MQVARLATYVAPGSILTALVWRYGGIGCDACNGLYTLIIDSMAVLIWFYRSNYDIMAVMYFII
jgi:hypothetical protein